MYDETDPGIMKWEPIETAPKDGTEIVLWCAVSKSLLTKCRWMKKKYSDLGWHQWLLDAGSVPFQRLESYEVPTHWMEIKVPKKGE